MILILIVSIFIAEAVAMLVLHYFFPPLSIYWTMFLDPVFVLILISPVFYKFIYLPIQESKKSKMDSEIIFSTILKTTGDGFWTIEIATGKFLNVNEAYCLMSGFSRTELLQMRISDIEANESPEEVKKHIELILKNGHDRFEAQHKTKSGSLRDVEVSVTFSENIPDRLFAFMHDITVEKKMRKVLEESEQLLNEAQQLSHLGNWTLDLISGEVKWSKTLYEINGRNPQLPPPRYGELVSCYTKESWEVLSKAVGKAISDGTPYELELDIVRADGKIIQTLTYGKAIRDKSGKVIQLHGTVQDISERKLAEKKLLKSEKMYRSLFENMLNGFAYCQMINDDDGKPIDFTYLSVNSAFETLTNLRNVVGKKVTDVIPGIRESDPELFGLYGRVSRTGKPERFEIFVAAMNMWFSVSVYCPAQGYFVAVFDVITERKFAEEELQKREAYLSAIIENQPGLVWFKDIESKFLLVNEAFAVSSGKQTANDLQGKTDLEIWPKDLAEKYRADDAQVMKSNKPISVEELIHDKGENKWFETFKTPVKDAKGKIIGTTGYAHDITERKQAEVALRESEKMFRLLYNETPVMMHSINLEGELLSVSDFWLEKLGYEREEVLGKNFTEFLTEASRKSANEIILPKFLTSGRIENVDYCFVKKNGEVMDCIVSAISQRDNTNKFVRSLAVITDITERNRVQRKLLDSEIKLHSVLQTTQDAIILSNENRQIIYWNDAAAKMFGYEEVEVLGKPITIIMPPHYERTFVERSAKTNGAIKIPVLGRTLEFSGLRKDGSEFPLEHSVSSWQSENGKIYCGILRDISVRKLAEERIIKSEELYRDIVENISDLICTHDLDGNILSVNSSAIKHLGFDEIKLLKMNVRDLLAYDVENQYDEYITVLKNEGIAHGFMKVRTATGKLRIWEYSNSLRTKGVDEPIVRGLAKDITERWLAESALRKSEANLHAIFENTNTGFLLMDTQFNILSRNDRAREIMKIAFGQKSEKKKNLLEMLPKERTKPFSEINKKVLLGETVHYEVPYPQSNGSDIWFEVNSRPVRNEKNKIVGISFSLNEITDRKKMTQELSESEMRNRLLLDTMMEGVLYVDNNDIIQYANNRFCEMLGYVPEELFGKVAGQIFLRIENRERMREIGKKRGQGIYDMYEMELVKKSGEKIMFQINGTPVKNEKGKIIGSMGTHTDITERKKSENEREKLIQDLSNKFNELMQFNYIVSHNLRSPIANILGLSNLLTMSNVQEDEKQKMFEHIHTAATNMDGLIKDLNVILSIRSSINVTKEKVLIKSLIKSIKHTLELQIMESNAQITMEFEDNATELFTVKSYLESILYNLINNAIKFHSSERLPKIIISSKRENGDLVISVSDNGKGIDLKRHGKQIFGLYKRFHLEVEGQGLGLVITKSQVEALGGKITVESEVNVGTKFMVRLPVGE